MNEDACSTFRGRGIPYLEAVMAIVGIVWCLLLGTHAATLLAGASACFGGMWASLLIGFGMGFLVTLFRRGNE